jgi:hypothetical protein
MGDEEYLITTNPDIGNGSPIIAGTRIKVEDVMRRIAGKQTVEEIARNLLLKEGAGRSSDYLCSRTPVVSSYSRGRRGRVKRTDEYKNHIRCMK